MPQSAQKTSGASTRRLYRPLPVTLPQLAATNRSLPTAAALAISRGLVVGVHLVFSLVTTTQDTAEQVSLGIQARDGSWRSKRCGTRDRTVTLNTQGKIAADVGRSVIVICSCMSLRMGLPSPRSAPAWRPQLSPCSQVQHRSSATKRKSGRKKPPASCQCLIPTVRHVCVEVRVPTHTHERTHKHQSTNVEGMGALTSCTRITASSGNP